MLERTEISGPRTIIDGPLETPTAWDKPGLTTALKSIEEYLNTNPQGVTSVFGRIGFSTLHLVMLVEGDSLQVETVRQVFTQGSAAWNYEHRGGSQFIEVVVMPATQEAQVLTHSTDVYYRVYDQNDTSDSFFEDSQAIQREQRQSMGRRNHGYNPYALVHYQPSRDHRGISDATLLPETYVPAYIADDYRQAENILDPSLAIDDYFDFPLYLDYFDYAQRTFILFEDRLDRVPLQDFTDQKRKHFDGFGKKDRLRKAKEALQPEISKQTEVGEATPSTEHGAIFVLGQRMEGFVEIVDSLPEPENETVEISYTAKGTRLYLVPEAPVEDGSEEAETSDSQTTTPLRADFRFRPALGNSLTHTPNGSTHHIRQTKERPINFDPQSPALLPPVVRSTQTLW